MFTQPLVKKYRNSNELPRRKQRGIQNQVNQTMTIVDNKSFCIPDLVL